MNHPDFIVCSFMEHSIHLERVKCYFIFRYFCYVDLNETRQGIEAAKKDILETSRFAPGGRENLVWPLGKDDFIIRFNTAFKFKTETVFYFHIKIIFIII